MKTAALVRSEVDTIARTNRRKLAARDLGQPSIHPYRSRPLFRFTGGYAHELECVGRRVNTVAPPGEDVRIAVVSGNCPVTCIGKDLTSGAFAELGMALFRFHRCARARYVCMCTFYAPIARRLLKIGCGWRVRSFDYMRGRGGSKLCFARYGRIDRRRFDGARMIGGTYPSDASPGEQSTCSECADDPNQTNAPDRGESERCHVDLCRCCPLEIDERRAFGLEQSTVDCFIEVVLPIDTKRRRNRCLNNRTKRRTGLWCF